MRKNNPDFESATQEDCYLPNFCQPETNLLLILVLELIAIVLALASATGSDSLLIHLALMSLYSQWIGLSSAAILCLLTRYQRLGNTVKASIISLLVVALMTAAVALLSYYLNDYLRLGLFSQQSLLSVLLQHEAISLILYALALRYFYIQFTSRQMIKAESHARLQALQARIRPHFLFNSLNTIASLTHGEPDKAEQAIENLAELFRASLKADTQISLQSEIELTRDYINLESLRLDDRLKVSWHIDAKVEELTMPALMLQPLVENAIYHGIEPQPYGGEVAISVIQGDALNIEIINPLNKEGAASHRTGNQMALGNIQERLKISYQGQAKFEQLVENDLYKVRVQIPINKNTVINKTRGNNNR